MGQPSVLPSIRVLIATSSISSSDNRKGEEAKGKKQSTTARKKTYQSNVIGLCLFISIIIFIFISLHFESSNQGQLSPD
jgi:hypothetical protein